MEDLDLWLGSKGKRGEDKGRETKRREEKGRGGDKGLGK